MTRLIAMGRVAELVTTIRSAALDVPTSWPAKASLCLLTTMRNGTTIGVGRGVAVASAVGRGVGRGDAVAVGRGVGRGVAVGRDRGV